MHLNEKGWCPADSKLHCIVTLLQRQGRSHPLLDSIKRRLVEQLSAGQLDQLHLCERELDALKEAFPKLCFNDILLSANLPRAARNSLGAKTLPRNIGSYELSRTIGSDSGSVHYEAFQTFLDRRVKIRSLVFPTKKSTDKAIRIARLEHPNVEFGIDCQETGSSWFLVTRYEPGIDLGQILSEPLTSLSNQRIVNWMIQLASATLELHSNDLSHLNIRCSNVLVSMCGEAILCNPILDSDFEEAVATKPLHSDQDKMPFPHRLVLRHSTGPESLRRIDCFSVGLILFQLLTGLDLDGFFDCEALPSEGQRLAVVIDEHLKCSKHDPRLKKLCVETTQMDIVGPTSFDLRAFRDRLVEIGASLSSSDVGSLPQR